MPPISSPTFSTASNPIHSITMADSNVRAIESLEEFKEVINSNKTALIDFWAPWCAPCRAIAPIFNNLSSDSQYRESVNFYKVDIEVHKDIGAEVGVSTIPTFLAFKNGEKVGELIGGIPQPLTKFVNDQAKGGAQ